MLICEPFSCERETIPSQNSSVHRIVPPPVLVAVAPRLLARVVRSTNEVNAWNLDPTPNQQHSHRVTTNRINQLRPTNCTATTNAGSWCRQRQNLQCEWSESALSNLRSKLEAYAP